MNCLYITLFFNIVAGIVQIFIKSWNQLLYPRVIEVCPPALWTTSWLLLAPHHRRRTFSQRDISLGEGASICANFSFIFLKKVIRDERLPTAPLFVVNVNPSFREFTAPLRHILPIHKVTINGINLFVNFRCTFTFCVEKSYDGTHLVFDGTLDRRCHFKHVSLEQSRFYHSQTSTAHR